MKKKKICFVLPSHWAAKFGGAEYQARCIIDFLIENGDFEITYLSRQVNPEFSHDKYNVRKIGSGAGLAKYGFFIDTFHLLSLLKQIKPDVIYQRVGCSYTGISAYYAKKANIKLIWHVAHDDDVTPFQLRTTRSRISRVIEKKFLEYGIRNATSIIAQTKDQATLLEQHYGRTPNRIIHNFHPHPDEKIKKGLPVKIVWVANFKRIKQPEIFIKLAKELSYISDVQFIMIGRLGRHSWAADMQEEINDLNSLVHMGALTQEEVNKTLAGADILVNTSISEGFSNTFIQAWMRQVPVVSLHVNPDGVFNSEKIGFCTDTYEKLKSTLLMLIENPSLRVELGNASREYSFENHSILEAEKILSVIKC